MKARQLIANASYGPDTLKVIFKAFDDAWEAIASKFVGDPLRRDAARLKLANVILSLANDNSKDADQLKAAALRVIALDR